MSDLCPNFLASNLSAAVLGHADFYAQFGQYLRDGASVMTHYAQATEHNQLILTAFLHSANGLHLLRGAVDRDREVHSLSADFSQVHIFEREIHEQTGLRYSDHPWLKPVRFPLGNINDYPFFHLDGKEIHEVAVGPIHAGVIEPGHFRFQCLGETVHHLEIHLGYQYRGIEQLLLKLPLAKWSPLIETIAGDTTIGHTWAHCRAVECLAGVEIPWQIEVLRGIALELERIAMHLVGVGGIATDIGFLQGGTTWGRLRTAIINTSMAICGSRFGRGWLRPGGVRAGLDAQQIEHLCRTLDNFEHDMSLITELFISSTTVRPRLKGIGTVTQAQAHEIGLVGMAARMCGIEQDLRCDLPGAAYKQVPLVISVEQGGDCWARAMLRLAEIQCSIQWLRNALELIGPTPAHLAPIGPLRADALGLGLCEGWRGEIIHVIQTDANGVAVHCKLQDPSLRNWFGLALAVRGNEISDFPVCNKSFDLSYCGSDL